MMIRFKETQYFSPWVKILLGLVLTVAMIRLLISFLEAESQKEINELIPPLVILILVFSLVGWLIYLFKIESSADRSSFSFSVSPLGIRKKLYWEDQQEVSLYNYKGWKRFPGGWGVRFSFRGERFYTAKGFEGIRFQPKNGKTIIVGTNKVEEAQQLIDFWKENYG